MADDNTVKKKCSSAIKTRVRELHKVQRNEEQKCAAVMRKGNKLQYVKGDLFSCPATHSLAHCISMDCHMGAGIAVAFKKKFKGVSELQEQKKEPGQCAVLKRDGRFVYYLITKKKYNNKPTYQTLRQSLEAMRDHCMDNSVIRLSMPRSVNHNHSNPGTSPCGVFWPSRVMCHTLARLPVTEGERSEGDHHPAL